MNSEHRPVHSVLREAHLRDYWKIVWQGRWTILAVFSVILGAAAIWTFLQTPIYRATAIVEVQPQARRVMGTGNMDGLGAAGYGWFAEEKYHNTQVEIIKSRDVAQRVVRTLRLEGHPMFAEVADPVDRFRRSIQVDPRRDTGLLEISIMGTDRHEITEWANAVAQVYVDRNYEKAKANVDKAIASIRDQMNSLSGELTAAEEVRIDALEDTQIFDSENQESILSQKLATYNSQLTDVRIRLSQLSDQLSQVRRTQAEGGDLMSFADFAVAEEMQELLRQRVEIGREIESAKVDLRPGHPDYEKKLGELDTVDAQIENKLKLQLANLQNEYNLASAQERYLESQVRSLEEGSLELAKATSKYNIIKTDSEMKQEVFNLINRTLNEFTLSAELMNNNVAMLDQATAPLAPIAPRRRMNLMIGAMFGLFLGMAAVFFLDYLDNTIRTPEDVEKYLGLSVVGVVPKLQDQGLAARAVKEAYQSLRTSIIFSSKNRQRKVILTTSTGPQEGKSSTVANLARTLAAAGERVIVIDCDLRKPTQHVHFKMDREPGLTNYLAAPVEEKDWKRYLKPATPATLSVLSSGPLPPSPPELLGGSRFKELLASMRESYDWILLDSPPAATLADAALLASLADMVVVVVEHNSTDRDHVVKTIQQLRTVNPSFAGVVLNNVDIDRSYNKDYYYAANYYYEEGDESSKGGKRRVERRAKAG